MLSMQLVGFSIDLCVSGMEGGALLRKPGGSLCSGSAQVGAGTHTCSLTLASYYLLTLHILRGNGGWN